IEFVEKIISHKQKSPFTYHNLLYTPRQVGIGRTMFLITEGDGANSYEGIDLSNPDICKREQIIHKLVEKIEKSPPMFRKTLLAQLLDQHLIKNFSIRVIRISILWMSNPNVLCVQGELKTASHHNGNVFWKMIKWYQQIGNLHIVAFITYGYKDVWDHTSATRTIDVSPFVVPRENIWSIKDVHFTKDEYEDYFLCFCKK
ncbi:21571_t:CDS:2, partial [Rhizophagus irregularis]